MKYAKAASRLVIVAILMAGVTTTSASVPASDGTYTGCYFKSLGTIRLIDTAKPAQKCLAGVETLVTWSQTGPKGPAGEAGAPGAPGAPGATGLTGPQGIAGPVGPTGPQGPSGLNGANGLPGAPGAPGTAGAPGTPGTNGTNGANGTNVAASAIDPITDSRCGFLGGVEVVQDGVSKAVVCSIQGPAGTPGAPGAPGSPGAQGEPGAAGSQGVAGPTGPQGPAGVMSATAPLALTGSTLSLGQVDAATLNGKSAADLINAAGNGGGTPITSLPVYINTPGTYSLSGNISTTKSFEGIIVNADDVTIDLRGFTISTSEPNVGRIGISSSTNIKNVEIKNGAVKGYAIGVYVPGVMNRVSHLSVSADFTSYGVVVGPGSLVQDCIVSMGSNAGGTGIKTDGGVVVGNSVFGPGSYGIRAANAVVKNNAVILSPIGSTQLGIETAGGGLLIDGNTITAATPIGNSANATLGTNHLQ